MLRHVDFARHFPRIAFHHVCNVYVCAHHVLSLSVHSASFSHRRFSFPSFLFTLQHRRTPTMESCAIPGGGGGRATDEKRNKRPVKKKIRWIPSSFNGVERTLSTWMLLSSFYSLTPPFVLSMFSSFRSCPYSSLYEIRSLSFSRLVNSNRLIFTKHLDLICTNYVMVYCRLEDECSCSPGESGELHYVVIEYIPLNVY